MKRYYIRTFDVLLRPRPKSKAVNVPVRFMIMVGTHRDTAPVSKKTPHFWTMFLSYVLLQKPNFKSHSSRFEVWLTYKMWLRVCIIETCTVEFTDRPSRSPAYCRYLFISRVYKKSLLHSVGLFLLAPHSELIMEKSALNIRILAGKLV